MDGPQIKRRVLVLDPALLDETELRRAFASCTAPVDEIVVFLSDVQASLARKLGSPGVRVLGSEWNSERSHAFLTDSYELLTRIENHPAATFRPWPERFTYDVNIGSLLCFRLRRGGQTALLAWYLLGTEQAAWEGCQAMVLGKTRDFVEHVRRFFDTVGVPVVHAHSVSPPRRSHRTRGGRRELRAYAARARQYARGLFWGLRRKNAPRLRLAEHRTTAAAIARVRATAGVELIPEPHREAAYLPTRIAYVRARDAIARAFATRIQRIRADVTRDMAPGWRRAAELFLDAFSPQLPALMADVVRIWWHLDRYAPEYVLEYDWIKHPSHATHMWCTHRGVPFGVALHGELSPVTGQQQARFLRADHVFCWDERSARVLRRATPEPDRLRVVVTGNPAYDDLDLEPAARLPGRPLSVLVALTAYSEFLADQELRSWQQVADLSRRLRGIEWTVRWHRVSWVAGILRTLFGAVPVRISERVGESFFDAAARAHVVVTNLSSVRADAIASGRLLIVWNDLDVADPLNDRPGLVLVRSAAELEALLARLEADPDHHAELLRWQAAEAARERLDVPAAEAMARAIVDGVRGADRMPESGPRLREIVSRRPEERQAT